jgi:cation:H+ antiporter
MADRITGAESGAETRAGSLPSQWLAIAAAAAAALPAPLQRGLEVSGVADFQLPAVAEAVIFGLGIFAAATLLTWASEVAETEISAGLALVVLALIAVLPEYAVDIYFAWTAPTDPENAHFAVANMTGGNRLLVGLAWPAIFFIFYLRTRNREMPVIEGNSVGILFLAVATLWSFTIPLRGHLSLIDTVVMFSLFGIYMYISSRSPPEEDRIFVGPAAAIASLERVPRRALVAGLFLYAAVVIFAAAEPFAESLIHTGESIGIDEFILVQWIAPLASESPEFILAGLLAARGRHDAGMTVLISSKVNQWTLLIGSLPLAFSISGGTLTVPLDFDSRQSEEVFLTAAQSLFAVAILVSLSVNFWEAAGLAGLFFGQFFLPFETVRLGFAVAYMGLALYIIGRDRRAWPPFLRVARETALHPQNAREGRPLAREHPPP